MPPFIPFLRRMWRRTNPAALGKELQIPGIRIFGRRSVPGRTTSCGKPYPPGSNPAYLSPMLFSSFLSPTAFPFFFLIQEETPGQTGGLNYKTARALQQFYRPRFGDEKSDQ